VAERFFDPRVCEVAALPTADATDGKLGSGVLVSARWLVTARHVAAPDDFVATAWRVRPLGTRDWLSVGTPTLAASGDIALLPVEGPEFAVAMDSPRLGQLASADEVVARGVGFPDARRTRTSDLGLPIGDPEPVRGELRPASQAKGALLSMHLWGSTPVAASKASSPWAGMSGAGVFVGPWLVGVVSLDPANFSGDRLEVTALASLDPDDPVWDVLELRPAGLEAADRPPLLIEPYTAAPPPRSARMLQARYGLVPFHGRRAELNDLAGWCRQPGQLRVGLVTAAGGQGKTRLAAELCERMAATQWLTGFVSPQADKSELKAMLPGAWPKLLVMDYADSRVEQVLAVTERAAWSPGRVRLLLLARHPGRWWESLPYRSSRTAPFENALVLQLEPTTLTEGARQAAFTDAADAFARILNRPAPTASPSMSAPTFKNLLYVHLAALTAVDSDSSEPGREAMVENRLLDHVLMREDVLQWEPAAKAAGCTGDATARQRAVAIATLTAADAATTATILQALPAIDAVEAARTVEWLKALDPSRLNVPPLEPDRLGEHLIASVLESLPELCIAASEASGFAHIGRTLATLVRAATTYSSARTALTRLLRECSSAILNRSPSEEGVAINELVAQALSLLNDPDLAASVLESAGKEA
jgi:hypothetical protein